MKFCSVEGCGSKVHCWGLCNKHRQQKTWAERSTRPCACGCEERTAATFVSGHNTRTLSSKEQSRRGRKNNGDKQRDRGAKRGYRKVRGRHEHRVVAEKKLGRKLRRGEIVHHKNHNKRDNREENLEVMTQSEHARLHMLERLRRAA